MRQAPVLEPADAFNALVSAAAEAGFTPVLAPTLRYQADILGVADAPAIGEPEQLTSGFASPDRLLHAEVFKVEGACLVVTVKDNDRGVVMEEPDGTFRRPETTEKALQISLLTASNDEKPLDILATLASELFGVPLETYTYDSHRFDELREEGRDRPLAISETDVAAAALLSDRAARSLAVSIKSSGGLLLTDIPKQLSGEDRSRVDELRSDLEAKGLIERDVVVICKRTQSQINRLPSRELLGALSKEGLKCACGRAIGDERVEEAVAVTDAGRSLLDGSRWFSILLLEELTRLGVPPDRILIEQESGGDEMDCIADVSGEVVFFELKDKEFSLGNAYSFGAKMGIVRPRHPVIVTTERVANDAKQHFSRARSAADGRRRYRTYGTSFADDEQRPVHYIEGLEHLSERLENIVGSIYRADSVQILREVLPLAAIPTSAVIKAVEGRSSAAPITK